MLTVNLENVDALGVYLIWQSETGKVVRVGQGNIKERLSTHREDPEVLQHRGEHSLLVSWASVPDPEARRRVERFLALKFDPLIPANTGTGPTIAVNTPTSRQ